MGCDIHLMAERKVFHYTDKERVNGKWINIDKWTVNPDYFEYSEDEPKYPYLIIEGSDRYYRGRNYNLFSALAGVRSYHFDGTPPMASKPKGLPKDVSKEIKKEVKKWGSDGHSHTWLTLAELKSFDWTPYGDTCDEFRNVTIPKLESAKKYYDTDDDIRIVFWFDN